MALPTYPDSRPLSLHDKPLLDGIFRQLQPRISEFTFANLFLFRTVHDYRLTNAADSLVILGKGYGGEEYFLPPLGGDAGRALAPLFQDRRSLYGADERFAATFLGDELVLTEDRDNFDYLHLRRELAELPGNRYHKKKNRINYFASRHLFMTELYSEKFREGCLRFLDEWERVHVLGEGESLGSEVEADREALGMAVLLGLAGIVVLVDGEVRGFALGEKLNDDTSVCHFEKADPFLEGIYQLLDREFNRQLFPECTYVNREQDLGVLNLRKSKLSYHPVALVKKFRAVVK